MSALSVWHLHVATALCAALVLSLHSLAGCHWHFHCHSGWPHVGAIVMASHITTAGDCDNTSFEGSCDHEGVANQPERNDSHSPEHLPIDLKGSIESIQTKKELIQKLRLWAIANGAMISSRVDFDVLEDGMRLIRSKTYINKGDVFMSFPKKLLLSAKYAESTELGQLLLSRNLTSGEIFRAHVLVDLRNESSFFKPYYDVIKHDVDRFPIRWGAEDLALLDGSPTLAFMANARLSLNKQYARLCVAAPLVCDEHTYLDFERASLILSSKTISINVRGTRATILVPIVDLMKGYHHSGGAFQESKWEYDTTTQSLLIEAPTHIHPGLNLLTFRGQKMYTNYFLNHGFVPEDSDDRFEDMDVEFPVGFNTKDFSFPIKYHVWKDERGFGGDNTTLSAIVGISAGTMAIKLIAHYRWMAANSTDLPKLFANMAELPVKGIKKMIKFLNPGYSKHESLIHGLLYSKRVEYYAGSATLEVKAMKKVIKLCNEILDKYPSTIDDDKIKLADLDLYPYRSNRRNAVLKVKSEKEVWHFYRAYALAALDMLKLVGTKDKVALKNKIEAMLSANPTINHNAKIVSILRDVVAPIVMPSEYLTIRERSLKMEAEAEAGGLFPASLRKQTVTRKGIKGTYDADESDDA